MQPWKMHVCPMRGKPQLRPPASPRSQADSDQGSELCDRLGIEVLPTVQFWRDGQRLWEHRGVVNLQQDLGEGEMWRAQGARAPGEAGAGAIGRAGCTARWFAGMPGSRAGVHMLGWCARDAVMPSSGLGPRLAPPPLRPRRPGVLYYGDSAANNVKASTYVTDLHSRADLEAFVRGQPDNVLTVVNVALLRWGASGTGEGEGERVWRDERRRLLWPVLSCQRGQLLAVPAPWGDGLASCGAVSPLSHSAAPASRQRPARAAWACQAMPLSLGLPMPGPAA